MKIYFLVIVALVLVNCESQNLYNEKMPDIIHELSTQMDKLPGTPKLDMKLAEVKHDSLVIEIYLDNSNSQYGDTLYHSSSFPTIIAYIGKEELTPPFHEQVFFDDLNSMILTSNSIKKVKTYQIKKLSGSPYKIVGLFRYNQNPHDSGKKQFWLVSEPITVK